ncbi:DJ-1/PfpI family protein [Vibrio penaeicida]|uniref:DJ-1/PfpI family protein n=1 Tax=Vibrio penaeicida TaxID=104609 RepID=UPI000CEA033F|nr:DJ-1/PfpI family protein [Vibrio penaeicida]
MKVGIVTLEGFNEIDSLTVFSMLNRLKGIGLSAHIVSMSKSVTSMNGLKIESHDHVKNLNLYDGVVLGSGIHTQMYSKNDDFLAQMALAPEQLIASQCSGVLLLDALKSLPQDNIAATDDITANKLKESNIIISNTSFHSYGNVATAGGCLASEYLATWLAGKLLNVGAARQMLESVVPVGEKSARIKNALSITGIK